MPERHRNRTLDPVPLLYSSTNVTAYTFMAERSCILTNLWGGRMEGDRHMHDYSRD